MSSPMTMGGVAQGARKRRWTLVLVSLRARAAKHSMSEHIDHTGW
ncbi:hypothetical protein [Nonomuraea aurantiaca]|nr:hypothetical protein [Nonomuraea aurantiaca]